MSPNWTVNGKESTEKEELLAGGAEVERWWLERIRNFLGKEITACERITRLIRTSSGIIHTIIITTSLLYRQYLSTSDLMTKTSSLSTAADKRKSQEPGRDGSIEGGRDPWRERWIHRGREGEKTFFDGDMVIQFQLRCCSVLHSGLF